MTDKRIPLPGSEPQPSLPHERDREGGLPYAKEVEDYKKGVVSPPEDQGGRRPRVWTHKVVGVSKWF
jgi:hypothetical protein